MNDEAREAKEKLAATLEAITAVDAQPWRGDQAAIQGRDAFEGVSGRVVRPNHALNAAKSPDSIVTFEYQDLALVVAAKAMHLPRQDFVLLTIGGDERGRAVVTAGYRLYRPADEVDELAQSARLAFQRFLEQHAIIYRPEGQPELFRPIITAPQAQDLPSTMASALGLQQRLGRRWAVHTQMRVNSDGTVTMAFPFALDLDEYEQTARDGGWGG